MPNKQVRGKFNHQSKIREKNERRIIITLTKNKNLTWTELREKTGISPPQLSEHLKRLKKQGKIIQDDKDYLVISKKLLIPYQFMLWEAALTNIHPYGVLDPINWFDKYGLAPLDKKSLKEIAKIIVKNQITLAAFIQIILANYIHDKDDDAVKNWTAICYEEMIPDLFPLYIKNFIIGVAPITTIDGKKIIGQYEGDGLIPPMTRVGTQEPLILKGQEKNYKTFYRRLREQYNQPAVKKEIQRRRRLRHEYIVKEYEKIIGSRYLKDYQNSLEFAEKTMKEAIPYLRKKQSLNFNSSRNTRKKY